MADDDIPVHNLKSKKIQRHNKLLPDEHLRAVFSGAPKSGKTQRLINMLLKPGFLDYNHLILFMPPIKQLCYHIMLQGFNSGLTKDEIADIIVNIDDYKKNPEEEGISNEELDEIIQPVLERREEKNLVIDNDISVDCYTLKTANELPHAEDLNPNQKHIFVSDDCTNHPEMKPIIADYFCNGRHNNISPIYLNQKFNNNDKVIRDNANMLFLFKLPAAQLKTIYDDWCSSDVDWKPFISAYSRVLKTPLYRDDPKSLYNFIVVDKTTEEPNRKYREGLKKPLFREIDEESVGTGMKKQKKEHSSTSTKVITKRINHLHLK